MSPQKQDLIADLGRHIEKLREQRGLGREQFAESSGLDLAVVEQMERGELPGATLDMLRRVCGVLELRLWELFEAVEKLDPADPFGARLVQLRTRRRWGQKRLAEASGLDLTTIADIESEKLSPDLDTLRRLARGLGLRLSELFEDGDPLQ